MTPSASLFDPAGQPVLTSAADWLTELLSGSVATAICVIAVATLGMMMLSGRISFRRGFQVILGCFLVLGASIVSTELQQFARGGGSETPPAPQVIEVQSPPKALPRANYDPYAGASLRRE